LNSLSGKILLKRNAGEFVAGYCMINEKLPVLAEHISSLHQKEFTYFNNLKFDKRRESYLLGRLAAKQAVAQLITTDSVQSFLIATGIFEFPVLKAPVNHNLQLCISHCDHIGVALAYPEEHPVGIDIEKIDDENVEAVKHHLTPKECGLIEKCGLPELTGYTILWTAKEALSKIFRTGLTMDLKILEIDTLQTDGAYYHCTFRNLAQYRSVSCNAGAFVCTFILPKLTTPELDGFWHSFKTTVASMPQ
jgi:4'-phosphopantetheinyl transferase